MLCYVGLRILDALNFEIRLGRVVVIPNPAAAAVDGL